MNRKHFFQAVLPLTVAASLYKKTNAAGLFLQPSLTPPSLIVGDTIGITCSASPVDLPKLQAGIKTLKLWGLNVQLGNTVGKHWQRFGGTDEERASDLQAMLDDDNIKAILFAKGGYGVMRMIDKIDWTKFLQKPKWLIGFSDITTVHLHVHANFAIPTIHADMATGITDDAKDLSATTLHDTLFGNRIDYTIAGHPLNREGFASSKLVGGNLSMLQACAASKSDIKTDGKILFIEDVSEYKYTIDRMLLNLKRSGKLDSLAGLMVGMFTATKTNVEDSFTETVEELIMEKVQEYKYPVSFNFPAGHITLNHALKMGVAYDFNVSTQSVTLSEKLLTDAPLIPTAPRLFLQEPIITTDTLQTTGKLYLH